jgi:hypothetical protein
MTDVPMTEISELLLEEALAFLTQFHFALYHASRGVGGAKSGVETVGN